MWVRERGDQTYRLLKGMRQGNEDYTGKRKKIQVIIFDNVGPFHYNQTQSNTCGGLMIGVLIRLP